MSEYESFFEWVNDRSWRDPDSGCLVWKLAGAHGGKEPQGRYMGKIIRVRRVLLELKRGKPLDKNITVKCSCETGLCVEPSHFVQKRRLGRKGQKWTVAQRAKMAAAARVSPRAKLSEEAVQDIRSRQERREVYAQKYDIAKEYVTDLQGYRAWKEYSNTWAGLALIGA